MRWSIHLIVLFISGIIALGGANDFDINSQLSEADVELYFESNHAVSKRATTLTCSYSVTTNSVVMETYIITNTYYTNVIYTSWCMIFDCAQLKIEPRTTYSVGTRYVTVTNTEYFSYTCYNGGTCNLLKISECDCTTGWEDTDCNTGYYSLILSPKLVFDILYYIVFTVLYVDILRVKTKYY
ncbi:hypothetical protein LOD99_13730 [Oopsacas minuta]|uniref:EGF-like domain-containing protein n=1 Tax=Oopsacas minuta TaxID=111878 RepID=A0AAV7KI43_9METZ|nr:hypothetical protein LOD99_13730 [Oopsacas minuta]